MGAGVPHLYDPHGNDKYKVDKAQGLWLAAMLPQLSFKNLKTLTWQDVKNNYEAAGLEDFELFWENKPVTGLFKAGLLTL